jgi:hypothetical protein
MNRNEIINNINNICSYSYNNNINMFILFTQVCEYSEFILNNVSGIIYNYYILQLEELYIDALFGNGSDSENVYNNYIKLLKYIATIL